MTLWLYKRYYKIKWFSPSMDIRDRKINWKGPQRTISYKLNQKVYHQKLVEKTVLFYTPNCTFLICCACWKQLQVGLPDMNVQKVYNLFLIFPKNIDLKMWSSPGEMTQRKTSQPKAQEAYWSIYIFHPPTCIQGRRWFWFLSMSKQSPHKSPLLANITSHVVNPGLW